MSKIWGNPIRTSNVLSEEEKRLNVLFAPFRTREQNPIDYDSKLKYWKNQILQNCQNTKKASFTITNLQKELSRKDRIPACLATVTDELLKSGDLMVLDSFLKINPDQSWRSWVIGYAVSPATWSFGKLTEALRLYENKEETYVSINYLKTLGEEIVQKIGKECVMTKEEFNETVGSDVPLETIDLLIHCLRVEKKCLQHTTEDGLVLLKIGPKVQTFSESEYVHILLEHHRKVLVKTIETLEKEKNETMELVRKKIREGNKILAKSTLRKSKELEKCIQKKCDTLDNLESMIVRMKETESDVEVFNVYKLGLKALKGNLKGEFNEDVVSNTMTEIQEIFDTHADIQSALSQPISALDDSQLENELDELLKPNEPTKDESFTLNLPDVPSFSPIKKKSPIQMEPIGLEGL